MTPPSDTAVSVSVSVTLTADERVYLELYTPGTYGVELPSDLAKSMEAKGLVERVLSLDGLRVVVFGGSRLYSITEAGKKALEEIARLRGRLVKETGRAEKIAADRDEVRQEHIRLRAELDKWQHNYLHLRSLLGVDREDGETDARLWWRTETALRKLRAELANVLKEHRERLQANAELRAELDYEKKRANLMGSTERDDVIRLRADQAKYHQNLTEIAQQHVKDLDRKDAEIERLRVIIHGMQDGEKSNV
jgi:hypothetical protein